MRGAAAIMIATIAVGCSALSPGAPDDVPCTLRGDGSDPCLELGRACVEGFCRSREVCNGTDDDLDGRVDEGPESDRDADGFTWCGGGNAALADCDDEDAAVHPADPSRGIAAPDEVCDGRDNQCDGTDVDLIEAANCTAPQRCSRSQGACVDPLCTYPEFRCPDGFQCADGDCVPGDCQRTGCTPGQVCDPVTRACVEPLPPGAACETDAQCADRVCMPAREALSLEVGLGANTRRICTRACCDDRDCPVGQACWAPGTGARGCVDRELLSQGSLGAPTAEERTCSDAIACEPSQCLPFEYDAYDRLRFGFVCAGNTARRDAGACRANSQCESGICLFGHEFWSWAEFRTVESGPCSGACRTLSDCRRFEDGWNQSDDSALSGETVQMGCLTARFTDTTDFTQACFESSGRAAGEACTTNVDCLERGCIDGICRATCCSNADCGSEICRPFVDGDHWEMRCAPPLQIL
ncbi:putative metal-binding motif-containing protein [Sandaracinus amylolyticus]|uniref:Uncharacterized protein n=1 Tax=Sandaracinus amylolyticus TaxID=927083 RepID=A0A0F6W1M5_9BACT|nr:putative metal-binding motif-containing protein [Sandaracinus amylolyticus]AKF05136.1 hypothetical protein DB32_002285 [Sandaracinus amylolyticus]